MRLWDVPSHEGQAISCPCLLTLFTAHTRRGEKGQNWLLAFSFKSQRRGLERNSARKTRREQIDLKRSSKTQSKSNNPTLYIHFFRGRWIIVVGILDETLGTPNLAQDISIGYHSIVELGTDQKRPHFMFLANIIGRGRGRSSCRGVAIAVPFKLIRHISLMVQAAVEIVHRIWRGIQFAESFYPFFHVWSWESGFGILVPAFTYGGHQFIHHRISPPRLGNRGTSLFVNHQFLRQHRVKYIQSNVGFRKRHEMGLDSDTCICSKVGWGTSSSNGALYSLGVVPPDIWHLDANSQSTNPQAYMSMRRNESREKLIAPSKTSGAI